MKFVISTEWIYTVFVLEFSAEGLVPHYLAFEAARDEHVVARRKLGADDEVLVDAEALAYLC